MEEGDGAGPEVVSHEAIIRLKKRGVHSRSALGRGSRAVRASSPLKDDRDKNLSDLCQIRLTVIPHPGHTAGLHIA